MNWYYLDTQQTRIGPISEPEMQNLVTSGALDKTSLVWNETLTEWTSVAQTPLATFCATATPPIAPTVNAKSTTGAATPSAQAKLLNKASILIKSLCSKTRAAACLSQKQALQQKLKMVDLNQADYNIGCKAFENKIGYNEYRDLYSQIEDIKSRIEKLKTKTSEPTVKLTEKAKAAAIGTAKAAEIGAQTINEKKALIALGAKLRGNPATYPSLTEEIGIANGFIEKASVLDEEIQALSKKSFIFAKYSWLILVIVTLAGVSIAGYILKQSRPGSKREALIQFNIGEKYRLGDGVEQSNIEAVKYFRKAAEQGLPDAQYSLGLMYALGKGIKRDIYQATEWMRKAAEQSNPKAEDWLGWMYSYSKSGEVKVDYEEAAKWLRKAADQGLANSQFLLGRMYNDGKGVPKDHSKAFEWFLKAAKQGMPIAQTMVFSCYYDGDGVKKDIAEAIKWLRKTADQGDEDAIKLLKKITNEEQDGEAQSNTNTSTKVTTSAQDSERDDDLMLRIVARDADMNEEQLARYLRKCADLLHEKTITPRVKTLAIRSLSAGTAMVEAEKERAAKGK